MNQPPMNDIIKAIDSVEYAIWQHLQRIGASYLELTNAVDYAASKDALKSFKAAAKDLERVVFNLLKNGNCPDVLILNVTDKALKLWTLKQLDGLWMNAMQFYQRFCHSQTQEGKVKELTSFYYLIQAMSDCALEVKASEYYGGANALRS